jgi:hypothetical protein
MGNAASKPGTVTEDSRGDIFVLPSYLSKPKRDLGNQQPRNPGIS